MTCPMCAATIAPGSRFCPACGHNLMARGDERRIVTVLFADLVGFTTLSEGLDPEHVKNIVDTVFEWLVGDVHRYGGRVDKIVGDAIVALFGAPVAHEDDAERAVRAALAMQETLQQRVTQLGEIPVHMRVGINTGEVLVGALRAGGDYTAMGDVVNVANRLQTTASAGEVLAGPATYAATNGVVQYQPVGSLDVRGRAEPVNAWRAITTTVPPGSRPRRHPTELVGRDDEMAVLAHTMAATSRRGKSHVALITGEPGIGKTRLSEDLTSRARREYGAVVLEGRCVPYGEANVWWPLATAIRQACDVDECDDPVSTAHKCRQLAGKVAGVPDDSAEMTRIADGLLYLLGIPSALAEIEPSRAREEALRAVHTILSNVASERPVVMVITELHWADRLLLDFVDALLARLRNDPFLFVATARPELGERWQPDPWQHGVVSVHMAALDSESSSQLLRALAGEDLPAALETALLERSGGNPLFLEELAAIVNETGVVDEVPASLRSLIATRLDALPSAARRALDFAAVIGRVGSVSALEALTGSEVPIAATLGELARRDLLSLEGDRWAFESELVREVAYDTITKTERARRHAALATWLQSQPGRETVDHLEQVAHHLTLAAELAAELGSVGGLPDDLVDRALHAITRAVEHAEHRELYQTAARLLERVIKFVKEPATRLELLVRRGRARAATRELGLARDDIAAVLRDSDAGDKTRAAALTVLGEIEQKEGELAASVQTLGEAIALWDDLGLAAERAGALRLRGMSRLFLGDLGNAEHDISEALAEFQARGERRGEAWAKQNLAWIALMARDHVSADERIHESMRIFGEIGDWGGWGWAVGLLSWLRYFQGNLDEAERLASGVVSELRERGDDWGLGMQQSLRANIFLWRGQAELAVDSATEARAMFAKLGDEVGEARASAPLARSLAALGRVDEATRVTEEIEAIAPTLAEPPMRAMGALLTAGIAVHLGDGHRAVEAAARILEGGTPASDVEVRVLAGLGALLIGETDAALAALEGAYDQADGVGLQANAGSALALTRAVARMGDESHAVIDEIEAAGGGTYLDHQLLSWARTVVHANEGHEKEARAEAAAAIAAADATTDVVVQAISRLVLARVLEVAADHDAARVTEEARGRLTRLGLEDTNWDRLFTNALNRQNAH